MIALLCSVPKELEALLSSMHVKETETIGFKTFYRGTIAGQEAVLCAGGMSKANAAHSASLLLTKFHADALVIFGIGGAYPSSGIKIGDVVIASEEIDGDTGVVTPEGFNDTKYIGIPLAKTDHMTVFNRLPASGKLLAQATRVLSLSPENSLVYTGRFVTVSSCTGTDSRARELEQQYEAICENMEGAAAAQVSALHDVPWLEVRGISNIVENRDLKKWDTPRACRSVQQAIQFIVEHWQA